MDILTLAAAGAIGYAAGSVSFAQVVARGWPALDVRRLREQSAGASTVYRLRGSHAAAAVLLGDVLKGVAAVVLARWLMSEQAAMTAGAAAVAGHNWPAFHGFKGGRGVAPAAGVLAALAPVAMGWSVAPALAVFVVTRNILMASAGFFWSGAALMWAMGYPDALVLFALALPAAVGVYALAARRRWPLAERWRSTFLRGTPR